MEEPIGYYTKKPGSPVMKPATKMTRYDQIRNMSIEEMAKQIIKLLITDAYCKNDCDGIDKDEFQCDENEELRCVVKWLNEEVQDGL